MVRFIPDFRDKFSFQPKTEAGIVYMKDKKTQKSLENVQVHEVNTELEDQK